MHPRCRNGRTTFTRRNWPSKRNATTVSRYFSFPPVRGVGRGGQPSRFVDAKPIYVSTSRSIHSRLARSSQRALPSPPGSLRINGVQPRSPIVPSSRPSRRPSLRLVGESLSRRITFPILHRTPMVFPGLSLSHRTCQNRRRDRYDRYDRYSL